MTKPEKQQLRGEAAFLAEKKRIAERNEAAYADGRRNRAAREAAWATRRRDADREADRSIPRRSPTPKRSAKG